LGHRGAFPRSARLASRGIDCGLSDAANTSKIARDILNLNIAAHAIDALILQTRITKREHQASGDRG
jgi:hypothetical protein